MIRHVLSADCCLLLHVLRAGAECSTLHQRVATAAAISNHHAAISSGAVWGGANG
jgi:hypothetical protein